MAVLKNKIELKNVSKVYETRDKQVEVLNNLSFEVHENEFLVLLGPGRCGKTVLLNILANLENKHPEPLNLQVEDRRWATLEWYSRNTLCSHGKQLWET